MKRWTPRIVALSMVVLLLGLALGGCANNPGNTLSPSNAVGGKDGNDAAQTSIELSFPLTTTPVELNVWLNWQSDFLDSPSAIDWSSTVEKKTGVKITYTAIPSASYQEKYGLLLASSSDDLPDIVVHNSISYPGGGDKAIDDGFFLNLNDLVENFMPNYKKLRATYPDVAKQTITDSGNIWAIYSIACDNTWKPKTEYAWTGYAIRTDWLKDLGLEKPHTIAQWENVLTQFKDKKGADAPMMLSKTGVPSFYQFISAYGVLGEFYNDNGTVKYGPLEDGYKQYVTQMADWYKKGLIDQNLTSNDVTVIAPGEYVATGRTGAHVSIWGFTTNFYIVSGQTEDPNFFEEAVRAPVLKEGDTAQARFVSYYTKNAAAITSKCKNPEIAAQWLDYFYTQEGAEFLNYGVEGQTYERDADGNYILAQAVINDTSGMNKRDLFLKQTLYDHFGLSDWTRFDLTSDADQLAAREVWNQDGESLVLPQVTLTADEGNEYNSSYADIKTLVQEKTVSFITGVESLDKFDAFVEQLQSLNIQRCIDIQQAAYDRYINRK